MKDLMSTSKLIAVLAVTLTLVLIGTLNLRDRLSLPPVADDGIEWVDTPCGVQAKSVSPDSPLAYTVRKGDYVRAFFYVGRYDEGFRSTPRYLDYEEVTHAETLARYLENQGVGNNARYAIVHHDPVLKGIFAIAGDEEVYDVDFKVVARDQRLGRGLYLAFIGLVYLAIGLFVLFKQRGAALTYHFYAWSLLSFVGYFYSSTLEFTKLDRLVSFLDGAAWALLAPLFLHFFAIFPSGRGLSTRWRRVILGLYTPAIALIILEAFWHYKPDFQLRADSPLFGKASLVGWGNILGKLELANCAVFFVVGSALLLRTFLRSDKPLLRQQLKWIVWGLGLSGVPFVLLYLIPYVSNVEISPVMETAAYGPLILIPLSFGYSIVRYRLMDVDVIMRRSFVHAMASIAVAAIYMAVLLGVGDLVKFIWSTADLNSWRTRAVVVGGMLIVAMLFAPIKNKLQVWADRWFYGERYTLRTGLQDFGRTLSQTKAMPQLLDSLVRRLSSMLSVGKVAIFIEDPGVPSGYRLAHAAGIEGDVNLPVDVKKIVRIRSAGRGFIVAQDLRSEKEALLDTDG